VKLIRSDNKNFTFQLNQREKLLLLATLELYPLVSESHHRLSKDGKGPNADDNQRLLEDALGEQRKENRRQVQAILNKPQRFRETKTSFELKLKDSEIEWLLQVLNDVRVGSWLALGEPEQGEEPEVTEENAKYLFAMQVCGMFESALLAALGISESPQWVGE
jgi:hypothetical protein